MSATPDLDAHAPPWSYNPSSWRQRIPICVLAGVATAIAGYMACYQWGLISTVWDPVFGKQTRGVLDSEVAGTMDAWLRFPDAALGAFAYLGDLVFGLAGSTRRWQYRPWLVIIFGIDVIPLGIVSAVLVVLQGFVVGQWCFLCLVTAVISLVLVVMAYDEVYASIRFLQRVWRRTKSRRVLWDVFWGRPHPAADAVALETNGTPWCGRASASSCWRPGSRPAPSCSRALRGRRRVGTISCVQRQSPLRPGCPSMLAYAVPTFWSCSWRAGSSSTATWSPLGFRVLARRRTIWRSG